DEEVATAHLLKLQLGSARCAIHPRDRSDRVGVSTHDRLQRNLDSQVELLRDQRLDVVNDFSTISLEGVGCIVVAVPEGEPNSQVDNAVHHELEPRITVPTPTGHEP